jgi:hypothetical protein
LSLRGVREPSLVRTLLKQRSMKHRKSTCLALTRLTVRPLVVRDLEQAAGGTRFDRFDRDASVTCSIAPTNCC